MIRECSKSHAERELQTSQIPVGESTLYFQSRIFFQRYRSEQIALPNFLAGQMTIGITDAERLRLIPAVELPLTEFAGASWEGGIRPDGADVGYRNRREFSTGTYFNGG